MSKNRLLESFNSLDKIGTDESLKEKVPYLEFKKWVELQCDKFYKNELDYELLRTNSKYLINKPIWRIVDYNLPKEKTIKTFLPPYIFPNKIGLGRCNYPYNPVFYGAVSMLGCFTEKFQDGYKGCCPKNIFLTCFEITNPISFTIINTPNYCSLDIFNEIYKEVLNEFKKQNFNENQINEIIEITNLISEEFLNPNDYTISAFISQWFLYNPYKKPKENNLILYPSVRNKNSFNLAIGMDYIVTENGEITNNLRLVDAIDIDLHKFNIDENGNGHIKYQVNKVFKSNDKGELVVVDDSKLYILDKIENYNIV